MLSSHPSWKMLRNLSRSDLNSFLGNLHDIQLGCARWEMIQMSLRPVFTERDRRYRDNNHVLFACTENTQTRRRSFCGSSRYFFANSNMTF